MITTTAIHTARFEAQNVAYDLLVAFHQKESRNFWLQEATDSLRKTAEALGYALTPIAAPAAEPVPATVQAAE